MSEMPTVCKFPKRPGGEVFSNHIPIVILQMGYRPFRSLPLAARQVKYLIVAIDYFTKWIEAEPLSSIAVARARKFVWQNIFTRFGILESVITDNGMQFADRKFRDFLSNYKVKHHFKLVEHPQANGQVEAANKIILRGLKKRLDDKKGAGHMNSRVYCGHIGQLLIQPWEKLHSSLLMGWMS